MGIVLLVVFGGLFAWNLIRDRLRQDYLAKHQPGPTTVSVTKVEKSTFQPVLKAVGTLEAAQQVNVTSQTGGKVTKILFKDGQDVEQGDLLVVLDDAVQRAQLEGAIAQREEAADAMKRFKPLVEEGAISELKYEQVVSQYKQATAGVEQARAALSFVRVTAPFSGRIGIGQVSLGQLVQPGQNIVTLDTEGGLYCDFTLPESNRSQVFVGQAVDVTTDAAPGVVFAGKVTAINPQVAERTRNFGVRATFPSEETTLTPGAFANIEVKLAESEQVIMVPRTAIAYTLYGDTAYVLQEATKTERDGKTAYQVKKVAVTPGTERDQQVVITKGLEVGELIVTSGQLRLEDGDWVTPVPTDLQAPKTAPLE